MTSLEPAILTIFGITGDLAKRKLLPALYTLANNNLLPESFKIVGISRQNTTVNDVIDIITKKVQESGQEVDPSTIARLEKNLTILHADITKSDDYSLLKSQLDRIEDETGICLNRIFYLAIPSALFGQVIEKLGQNGLNTGCQHNKSESRLLIEKPFGYDLISAKELIEKLNQHFDEKHIYRIDHYLAKETAQNILTFRFENPLFNGCWDSDHISHIMITASESIGIEGRTSFYEQTGALRDIIQSHLLQLLSLVAMEQPKSMSAEDIHIAKGALLDQVKPPHPDEMDIKTIRGQYDTYRDEVKKPDSQTETFAAIELSIDSPRWAGVPIFIRTGKSLAEKASEITIVFRNEMTPDRSNYLTIRIQPNEGISLNLRIKKPGFENEIDHAQMDFCYGGPLDAVHPDAYERVMADALKGDQTLFATSNEVLASWQIAQPILHAWRHNQSPLHIYKTGSWGPNQADTLLEKIHGKWLTGQLHICQVHPSEIQNQ